MTSLSPVPMDVTEVFTHFQAAWGSKATFRQFKQTFGVFQDSCRYEVSHVLFIYVYFIYSVVYSM